MLDVPLDSPALRVVSTLSLVLVLFIDAVNLDIREVQRHGLLALRLLGPGTLLSAALIGLVGWALLGLPPAGAAILGAALASTDPVLLRGLLRLRGVPGSAQQALRLESGLNDAVLLPIVLVAMAVMRPAAGEGGDTGWVRLVLNQFLLGPSAGIAVGLLAVAALDLVRRRSGVRRDYEALYAIGVAFAAFAAAEAVHGSGFLAAFAAGLTIAALDVELCDCFLEYGETTSEMALLLTFVLLGSSLMWSGLALLSLAALAFAVFALSVRFPVYHLALLGATVEAHSRKLIAWFGPRGLSSLLLVLLPVFAGLPGSGQLFAYGCLVVVLSIVVHGGSIVLYFRKHPPRSSGPGAAGRIQSPPEARPLPLQPAAAVADDGAVLAAPESASIEAVDEIRLSIEALHELWDAGAPVHVLDVRTERAHRASDTQARGALRVLPNEAVARLQDLGVSPGDWLVAYCA